MSEENEITEMWRSHREHLKKVKAKRRESGIEEIRKIETPHRVFGETVVSQFTV